MTRRTRKYFKKNELSRKLFSDIAFNILASAFRQQLIAQSPLPHWRLGGLGREIARKEMQIAIAEETINTAFKTVGCIQKYNKKIERL